MKTLQELITRQQEINARMAEIKTKAADESTSMEDLTQLRSESESLNKERAMIEARIACLRSEINNPEAVVTEPTGGAGSGAGNGGGSGASKRSTIVDPYATLEYRQAFMDYVTRGIVTPQLRAEGDAAGDTGSGTTGGTMQADIKSVIIPTTITEKLFKRNERAGYLFARVRKTNYKAGMTLPMAKLRPRLEWVGENKTASKTKATTGSISFSGFKGQIKIALSLEAQVKSIEGFEEGLIDAILEGCAESFDEVITMGDGNEKPTGVIPGATYTGENKKAVVMNNKQIEDYSYWIQVYSKLPLKKQAKAQLHINKSDWQSHVLGMKDSNGKVIALETMGFGGNLVPMFMGREVVLLEDQGVPTFDSITRKATPAADTAFAYFLDNNDYWFNSNMQLTLRKYIDEDTDEEVSKATIICDGKVADTDSLLVICRGANAS